MPHREWLLLSEAASEVGLSEVTLRGYANGYTTPQLRTTKRGRWHVVSRADLEKWKQERQTKQAKRGR